METSGLFFARSAQANYAFIMGERIDRETAGRLYDLASAHRDSGRLAEALVILDRVVQHFPELAALHVQRGSVLHDMQHYDQALASFDAALAIDPVHVEALIGKGAALQALGRPQEALIAYERALALQPRHARALSNGGLALREMGRVGDALRSYDAAIALMPDCADLRVGKAMCLLLLGQFEEGWRLYEAREDKIDRVAPPPGARPWRGEDLAGKRLLIQAEQGLGDTIQFCRFAGPAQAQGAEVVLQVQEQLTVLTRSLPFPVAVIGARTPPPVCDYHVLLLDLPLRCMELGLKPASVPYLAAEPARVQSWRARIGTHGLKIGLSWQGGRIWRGQTQLDDGGRSFPLGLLESISRIPQVRLISLQKNEGIQQLARSGLPIETLGEDFDAGPQSFLDSAAVMESLDLVITADTALAHLAGALGRPVWLALKYAPDWRWLLEREDSPWYPSMRLFRQTASGDWRGVFAQMETELRARALI